jgi:hypothetical protein
MSLAVMRNALLFLICVLPLHVASAQSGDGDTTSVQVGQGLICNTEQQAARYVTLFDGDSDQAVGKVNAEANDDNACAVAGVAFVPMSAGATTVRNGSAAYRVVQIVILGVVTPAGVQKVAPFVQFAVTPVEEIEI